MRSARLQVVADIDGSCLGNPGPGGWAVILRCGEREKVLNGGAPFTTNNAMELRAVLEAVRSLRHPCRLVVRTDSRLVIGWLSGKFRRKDVEVRALCAAIEDAVAAGGHDLTFEWISGHSGDSLNERADLLSRRAAERAAATAEQVGAVE